VDERALSEFESVFEASVKPSVRLDPIAWHRVLVALDGSERAASSVAVACHLAGRAGCPVHLVATRALLEGEEEGLLQATLQAQLEAAQAQARDAGVKASGEVLLGLPGEVLLAQLQAAPTSLLVIPTPHGGQTPDQTSLGSTVDHLLKVSDCPTLLIKAPVSEPTAVFQRLLAYIPGGFEVGPHFSVPFGLVEPGGDLELMHVVNDEEVRRYAAAFGVAPAAGEESGRSGDAAQAMSRGIEERMTALLEAAVKEVREEPFDCRSAVSLGDPVQKVALHLVNHGATLLVVESESRPETAVSPEAYTLLKEITGVPILAL
jgi:nucleotide-binding universal stress UspA family protein